MKGKLLRSDQGISHEVFREASVVEGEEQAEGEGEEGQESSPKDDDILKSFRHIYVKEVVREPKMHFYKVPRLGSFLAIPLVYNSCLFEDALDNAVQDFLNIQKTREEQNKEKTEWEEEQARQREEREKVGEQYEAEPREWEPIEEKPFDTVEEQYVICFDTLGQDREIDEEQRRFALDTVRNFKRIWEETEYENLTRDRNRKLEIMELDKEFLDTEAQKILDEEERNVEEIISSREDPMDDEQRDLVMRQIRLSFIGRLFKEREDWHQNLMVLRDFNVIKMQRVVQTIFYLLKYKREDICEKGTNKFFWKKAKNLIDDEFINRLVFFNALGPKEDQFERYQTLNFLERNVEGIQIEEVDAYNLTLGKLFKWILLALKTRKEDIVRRKAMNVKAQDQRTQIQEAIQAREVKKG